MNAAPSVLAQGIDACVGIVRFRKGPEDVPASTSLLAMAVIGGVLLRIGLLSIPAPDSQGNPVVLSLLDVGITLVCLHVVLRMSGTPERFIQTVTAIYGCQFVLAPAWIIGRWLAISLSGQAGTSALGQLAYLAVAGWLLAVVVRILRSATGWPIIACVLLVLSIELLGLFASLTLYPPVAAPASPAAPVAAPT